MSNALVPVDPNNEAGIAESLMHYFTTDTKQARYLGFRVCGFSAREARRQTPVTYDTVKSWREKDAAFEELDLHNIKKLRRRFRKVVLESQYFRNYILAQELDAHILIKAALGEELTSQENLYLRNIRKIYTPQQMAALEASVQLGVDARTPFQQILDKMKEQRNTVELREIQTRREVEIRPE